MINREPVQVRRPEKDTRPGVFYKGAHQATLDPLAARRPDGGLFAWATQGAPDPQLVTSGTRAGRCPRRRPCCPTTCRTTRRGAGGSACTPGPNRSRRARSRYRPLLAFAGLLPWGNAAARWAAPVLSLAFLALTGGLLVADLKHPERFYLIFTRCHWRSWLVRGAFILGGFGGIVAGYLLAALAGATGARQVLAALGLPLATAAAVYTAYLFAQAKARDLWQSPLLPPHLAVQAALAGAAAMLPLLAGWRPGARWPRTR